MPTSSLRRPWLESALTLFVLLVLVAYLYATFFTFPYLGFDWYPQTGQVLQVFLPDAALRPDDVIVRVADMDVASYRADLRRPLPYQDAAPGTRLALTVERGGQTTQLEWTLPGFNPAEFLYRLNTQAYLAVGLWLIGVFTLLAVRPRDERWRLLIAFDGLTALWLIASSVSRWHILESAILLHIAIWFTVPVYWQLHWNVPHPLGRLPRGVWLALYSLATLLSLAEWFEWLPPSLYMLGFLLAFGGSVALFVAHLFRRPQRREMATLLIAGALAFLPPVVLGLAGLSPAFQRTALVTLFSVLILPLGYLYAAYRRQLGGVEVRVTRAISTYLFLVVAITALAILAGFAESAPEFPGKSMTLALGAALAALVAAAVGYVPFQRFVERRLLGIPLPPERLLQTYAERVAGSPDRNSLAQVLRDEILPSLLVRESALLQFSLVGPSYSVIYASGDPASGPALPAQDEIRALLAQVDQYRGPASAEDPRPCPWVRLALPLTFGQQAVGLWLLGRRDPDDYYSQRDIEFLRTLAHQTSIALANIVQAERLSSLYRADIDRAEAERTHLAHELHDDVLNELGSLKTSLDMQATPARAFESVDRIIARLREIVRDLRPAMLNFGLRAALSSLVDDLTERPGSSPAVQLDLPESEARYDAHVEQHLYRIVQQACENALLHAQAQSIAIRGSLAPDRVDLTVEDDGRGFETGPYMGLVQLLARHHFGLAGMVERAGLIGAQVEIGSAPGRGTRVRVTWRPEARRS